MRKLALAEALPCKCSKWGERMSVCVAPPFCLPLLRINPLKCSCGLVSGRPRLKPFMHATCNPQIPNIMGLENTCKESQPLENDELICDFNCQQRFRNPQMAHGEWPLQDSLGLMVPRIESGPAGLVFVRSTQTQAHLFTVEQQPLFAYMSFLPSTLAADGAAWSLHRPFINQIKFKRCSLQQHDRGSKHLASLAFGNGSALIQSNPAPNGTPPGPSLQNLQPRWIAALGTVTANFLPGLKKKWKQMEAGCIGLYAMGCQGSWDYKQRPEHTGIHNLKPKPTYPGALLTFSPKYWKYWQIGGVCLQNIYKGNFRPVKTFDMINGKGHLPRTLVIYILRSNFLRKGARAVQIVLSFGGGSLQEFTECRVAWERPQVHPMFSSSFMFFFRYLILNNKFKGRLVCSHENITKCLQKPTIVSTSIQTNFTVARPVSAWNLPGFGQAVGTNELRIRGSPHTCTWALDCSECVGIHWPKARLKTLKPIVLRAWKQPQPCCTRTQPKGHEVLVGLIACWTQALRYIFLSCLFKQSTIDRWNVKADWWLTQTFQTCTTLSQRLANTLRLSSVHSHVLRTTLLET